jgi:hypothetical protein
MLPDFLDSWRELFFCIIGLPVALLILRLVDRAADVLND